MAYQQKPGDCAVFKEKQKKSDKSPDWKGTLMTPDGEVLSVALWVKNDGMLTGKVEVPRQQQQQEAVQTQNESRQDSGTPFDDDVPW